MSLELSAVFSYAISDHKNRIGETSDFNNVNDLKTVIQNGRDYFQMPYKLNVTRAVKIIDPDSPNKNKSGIITESFVFPHPITLKREGFDFIVSDKLTYPRDVRKILTKKYGGFLDFDCQRQWNEKEPVFLDGILEEPRYGLRNPHTGASTQYVIRRVVCYPLGDKHIVIDGNLNQIYPEKTGKMPDVLKELLANDPIKIIQR